MTSTDEHPGGYSTAFSRIVGLVVAMVGGAVLLGWWLDIATLKSIFPGLVSMKVNSAIGVLWCGVALALLSRKRVGKSVDYLAAVLALAVTALGVLTLCEYLLGWDLRIDQWLFGEEQRSEGTSHPGRMSPASALCFVFMGVALLVATLPGGLRLRQASVAALSVTVALLGILALAGYLLEAGLGYHIWNYTGTAVHAATSFIFLGGGLLALVRSEGGLLWSLDARTTAGFIAAIALMVTVTGSSYNFAKQQQQTAIQVSHTQEVLKGLEKVKSDLADLESNQRGYIITGTESLRERFIQAEAQLDLSLASIARLIADDANQQQRLKQLEALLGERLDFAKQSLAARRQQGFAAAQQLLASEKGIALTDSLAHLLKGMQDEERARLDAHQQQSAAASVTTFLLLPLGVFLSLAMLSLGLFFLNAGVAEQAQAELAMEESQARMAGIVNSAMDAIISVNSEQKIILFNSAAEKIFRCPAAKAIGQEIQTFIPQRFRGQHPQHVQGFGQTGVTSRSMQSLGTLSGLRFDGEEFPLEASISQIEVAGQKVFTVILRDITERKQAEEALQNSEHRFRALIEHSSDSISLIDKDNKILYLSPSVKTVEGYAPEELLGRNGIEHTHPDDLPLVDEIVQKLLASPGKPIPVEWRRRHKNGQWIWLEGVATNLLDDPAIGAIVTNYRDITERRLAENAVRQSEDRLAFALQVSGTGAWDLDLLDHTAHRSLQHDRIFGYQTLLPVWTYEMFLDHVLPEDRFEVDSLFGRAMADKGDWSFECRIRRSDGEVRWIWASGRHRLDASGVARTMSGIVQDITERKQAQEAILQLNEELEQRVLERTTQLTAVNKELEAFSYSVSHDLRAPLRHINGFSQALLEDYADKLDEEGRSYLQEVRNATHEMAQLIDDVLQLARVTRSEMHKEAVNLSEAVFEVLGQLKKHDRKRQVVVEVEEGLWVQGDKRLLQIMLRNLLENAWKFTSKRELPEIAFRRQEKNGETVYFVRDNGAGFDMAYAGKLFGAFQRLHSVAEFEGTGVGLAIVQRIISRHGGRVWAEAAVNEGATFYFTLASFTQE